jgi:hypothetical protein
MIYYWLILVVIAANSDRAMMLHVGTFKSHGDCETAAKAATTPVWPAAITAQRAFICAQANEVGTAPPP